MLIYVDYIIVTENNSSLIDSFTRKLHYEFATKDLGSLSYFLRLEASPTPDGLFINQLKYARDILIRAQLLDNKPTHTPMVVSQHLTNQPTLYRSLVVNSIGQFLYASISDHFFASSLCQGTLHFGLIFHPSIVPSALVAYSDDDWAGCLDTRHSTSCYSIYLGNDLVSCSAKKQPTVSLSSCESEYRAPTMTATELLWVTHLSHYLKVLISQQSLLLCDNKSAIFFSSNHVSHRQVKYVELDYHFLCYFFEL